MYVASIIHFGDKNLNFSSLVSSSDSHICTASRPLAFTGQLDWMSRKVPSLSACLNTDPGRLFCSESTDLGKGTLLPEMHCSVIPGNLLKVLGKFSKARTTSIPYLIGPTYREIKFCRGKEVERTQTFFCFL